MGSMKSTGSSSSYGRRGRLLIFVIIFQVEDPAVIVEPHFMDMLFEQVRATYGNGTDTLEEDSNEK